MIVSLPILLGMALAPQPAADAPSAADVAQCVVDNDMADVRILLKTVPGSPAETRASINVRAYYGGCSDNKVATGNFAWRERAEIAEAAATALLQREAGGVTGAGSQADWMLALPKTAQPGVDYSPVDAGMRILGDCIVKANPQSAVALVRADRGSVAEAAAINGLSGNIAPCVPAKQALKIKRQDLRLIVAEPLYHLLSR